MNKTMRVIIKYVTALRATLRLALLVLLAASIALGGTGIAAPAGPARAQAAQAAETAGFAAESEALRAPTPAQAPADLAAGAAEEQPHSWLLKWIDPALAHELRGVEVLHRQEEAAVDIVRPAPDTGEDVEAWLRRLRGEPNVQYVHPNERVHILSPHASAPEADSAGALPPAEEAWAEEPGSAGSPTIELPAVDAEADTSNAEDMPSKAAAEVRPLNLASANKANDPELAKQTHLEAIGAPKAWETVKAQTNIIIAVVDTGVDLEHPDLKDNLVEGYNLINPKLPPKDDNGHGTSVAGVLAASGNNGIGVSGVLWNAKIMPIKALDRFGDGTEQNLGEGILHAIRSGAKIVVLSVGLYRYSPYMLDIVQYAERQGVLLVAASGNDGLLQGSKAVVKYPAAYPTVVAVGGARPNGTPDTRSNPGPELDLLAPWNVYTTAMGGAYHKEEGTSMATPQVAGAAALVMAQNPEFRPSQVRALLRQTAKDTGQPGFDSASGYGLLQLDQAVTAALKKDAFEPNNTIATATPFPLPSELSAELGVNRDEDWYVIDAPESGKLTLQYDGLLASGETAPVVMISHYSNGKQQFSESTKLSSKRVDIPVLKGKQHIQIKFGSTASAKALSYTLSSSFVVNGDAYEPNDRFVNAAPLQPVSQTVQGNFHQIGDRDWYSIEFKQDGRLQLTLSTDTARIDPGLSMQREGQALKLYDERGEGETETTPFISVTPGKYLIRVHNAISTEASPTVGTYTLMIDFQPQLVDPNEPNDKSYEALMMSPGTEYRGVIDKASDIDWFQFRLVQPSAVSLSVTGVPADAALTLEFYDKRMARQTSVNTGTSGKLATGEQVLEPGVYYVKLTANKPFNNQYYRLKLTAEELVAGFRDIKTHWARNEIVSMSQQGIISGTGHYRFEPNRNITRAEAVALIVKAYKPLRATQTSGKTFNDLSSTHWAYDAVARAVQMDWIQGFPDGSFRPGDPITRAEMAVIIGRAEGIRPRLTASRPFSDIPITAWYASMIAAMHADGKLKGVDNNRFNPNGLASRAEFTSLVHRYLTD